jgi:hypothetical protein
MHLTCMKSAGDSALQSFQDRVVVDADVRIVVCQADMGLDTEEPFPLKLALVCEALEEIDVLFEAKHHEREGQV